MIRSTQVKSRINGKIMAVTSSLWQKVGWARVHFSPLYSFPWLKLSHPPRWETQRGYPLKIARQQELGSNLNLHSNDVTKRIGVVVSIVNGIMQKVWQGTSCSRYCNGLPVLVWNKISLVIFLIKSWSILTIQDSCLSMKVVWCRASCFTGHNRKTINNERTRLV